MDLLQVGAEFSVSLPPWKTPVLLFIFMKAISDKVASCCEILSLFMFSVQLYCSSIFYTNILFAVFNTNCPFSIYALLHLTNDFVPLIYPSSFAENLFSVSL